jgi:hypothetical protein
VGLASYAGIWLGYANLFIALFVMIYAYLFLKQTKEHKDRRPWDFLFVASLLYFLFQIFNMLFVSGITTMLGDSIDIDLVRTFFAFLYSGSVLLAFVSQHDLILKSELILISKRDKHMEAQENVEVKIGTAKAKK